MALWVLRIVTLQSKLLSESAWVYMKSRFKIPASIPCDCFGSHLFQHLKSDEDIRALVKVMQPDTAKVSKMGKYFLHSAPIGCALWVLR